MDSLHCCFSVIVEKKSCANRGGKRRNYKCGSLGVVSVMKFAVVFIHNLLSIKTNTLGIFKFKNRFHGLMIRNLENCVSEIKILFRKEDELSSKRFFNYFFRKSVFFFEKVLEKYVHRLKMSLLCLDLKSLKTPSRWSFSVLTKNHSKLQLGGTFVSCLKITQNSS